MRPARSEVRDDALAGLTGAVANVPDGMAASVLTGVNPVFGLYACFAGPVAGGLTASTRLMVIATTSAAALAAGSALASVDAADRPAALFLLTLLAGAAMVLAGVLHLGRYTRFVSHSVMLGFLTGIAVNIVAGQIPDLTGADAHGRFALAKVADVVANPSHVDLPSLLVGLGALAVLVLSARHPRLALVGPLLALAVPTLVAVAAGVGDQVSTVADVGDIPGGLPLPAWPRLGVLSFSLVTGALSVAAIVLVQGAGVAEIAPNPAGARSDADRDFVAQGVGNLASGLWQGVPVGGSLGATALNRTAGARSRWGGIASGLWMLAILVAFSGVVGHVALPTLAAVLVYAGVGSLRPREVATVLGTGRTSQVALVTTFLATLFLPVTAAVGIGVALSLLLQLNQEAMDLSVVELVRADSGGGGGGSGAAGEGSATWKERPAPAELPSRRVTVLDVYGSLLYAGARTLQARLPRPAGAEEPVVVLRLRGRTVLGATFFLVVADYAERLEAAGGRLYLSGIDPALSAQLQRSGRVHLDGPVPVFAATETLGASTASADDAAEAWLVRHAPTSADDPDGGP